MLSTIAASDHGTSAIRSPLGGSSAGLDLLGTRANHGHPMDEFSSRPKAFLWTTIQMAAGTILVKVAHYTRVPVRGSCHTTMAKTITEEQIPEEESYSTAPSLVADAASFWSGSNDASVKRKHPNTNEPRTTLGSWHSKTFNEKSKIQFALLRQGPAKRLPVNMINQRLHGAKNLAFAKTWSPPKWP